MLAEALDQDSYHIADEDNLEQSVERNFTDRLSAIAGILLVLLQVVFSFFIACAVLSMCRAYRGQEEGQQPWVLQLIAFLNEYRANAVVHHSPWWARWVSGELQWRRPSLPSGAPGPCSPHPTAAAAALMPPMVALEPISHPPSSAPSSGRSSKPPSRTPSRRPSRTSLWPPSHPSHPSPRNHHTDSHAAARPQQPHPRPHLPFSFSHTEPATQARELNGPSPHGGEARAPPPPAASPPFMFARTFAEQSHGGSPSSRWWLHPKGSSRVSHLESSIDQP